MPTIRFTADPKLPRDWADKPYRKGYEADVSEDEANRWVRRGVATILTPAMKAAETRAASADAKTADAADDVAPEIPDDWRDQHHQTRIALARRLAPERGDIDHAADADAVIAAEVERRAAEAANS